MLFDLLTGPVADYLLHGISAGRAVMRLLAAGAFAVGGYVFLTVASPLRYLAAPLFVFAGLYTLYDLATVASHTR